MKPSLASGSRRASLIALSTAALLAAAGCAGSKAATSKPSASLSLAPAPTASASTGQRSQRPVVSGLIAAIEETTLQVQDGTAGQTAVTYTAKTTFTQSVPAALADVSVGSCVTVTGADAGSSSSVAADPSEPLTAARVTISTATDGVCAGGFGGGQGFPGGGFGGRSGDQNAGGRPGGGAGPSGGARPSGGAFPSGGARPSGAPGAGFRGANGQVTSVNATGFVVKSPPRPGVASSSTGPSADAVSTAVTVTLSTILTKPKVATAAALKVGECVTALGATDSTGAMTATAISIRAADANGCGQRRAPTSGGSTGG